MSGGRRRDDPPHSQHHAVANGGAAGRGSVWGKALRSDSAWHDKVGPGRRDETGGGRDSPDAAAPSRGGSGGPAVPECGRSPCGDPAG